MRGARWVVLSIRLGDGSRCFCRFADDLALYWSVFWFWAWGVVRGWHDELPEW